MRYDFIEIGTSDFDTLIEVASDDTIGLSVDPMQYYLDRLPSRKNVTKVCAAIGEEGEMDIYYIPEQYLELHCLPRWIRGCNSVGKPHKFTVQTIGEQMYRSIVKIDKVKVISLSELLSDHLVTSIGHLKIDTEGMDHIILGQLLALVETNRDLLPQRITFEMDSGVSDMASLEGIILQLEDLGYSIQRGEADVTASFERVEKAYVLYANEVYLPIAEQCVNSINTFSSIPIIVYVLNSTTKIEGALTVNYRCDIPEIKTVGEYIDRKDPSIYRTLIERPSIVRDALTHFAETIAFIDADSIATRYVDNIFSFGGAGSEIPFFVEGIYDYLMVDGHADLETPACKLFGVDQGVRRKYRQSGFFVAGKASIPFLEEWREMCLHPEVLKNNALYAPFNEETILNVILWKHNFHQGLPYI